MPVETQISPEVRARYEAVIGLEVHVQLLTKSKIFCGCSTRFGVPPNSQTCPVCLGLPGALPVLNREAVTMALKAALGLNCTVNPYSRFARKNYFYPDLPKGYQISQYDQPLAEHGWLEIEFARLQRQIGITRVHLEEDAGKSLHEGFADSEEVSYIDLNRSGVPLIEIVSEPDLRTPEESYAYLTRLKTVMLYLEVSDCNMEEGSLRCDANVSVRVRGAERFGTKTEVKNVNSFRFIQRALAYEIDRQIEIVESGGQVLQETRLWDSREQRTYGMRSKEHAQDYRYFPEPDLPPLIISAERLEEVRRSLPELPQAKEDRFISQYHLPQQDAQQLASSRAMADFFEAVVETVRDAKLVANWIIGEYSRLLKEAGGSFGQPAVAPQHLAELLSMVGAKRAVEAKAQADEFAKFAQQKGEEVRKQEDAVAQLARQKGEEARKQAGQASVISGTMAKEVLRLMFQTGKRAQEVLNELGMSQVSDADAIATAARQIIASNPKQVEQYQNGKTATLGWFVGQVMKATRGQANPQVVQEVLKRELGN
jgi:aspartyl-tRNA(Asn)/glutamyl-tRNA(Gln) amidotransferase subunit B